MSEERQELYWPSVKSLPCWWRGISHPDSRLRCQKTRERHAGVRYSLPAGGAVETALGAYAAAAIVELNAIGKSLVRTIEIEPATGHHLVPSAEERQLAVDTDSRVRTHLANERTFLAWLRTGLSLMAVGLAAAGFLPVDLVPGLPYVRLLAAVLVLAGAMMVLYGASRYLRACRQIETGSYDPASNAVVTIAAIIGLLGILAIPLVLLLR
jgi:putative membrane protein